MPRPLRTFLLAVALALWVGCVVEPPVVQQPPTPPAPQVEGVPAAPGAGYVWLPGHWAWRGPRRGYVWAAGRYDVPAQPGYAWIPGYWAQSTGGYVWIEGHWRAR